MAESTEKHQMNGHDGKRWLIVVARGQADLYSHLVQAFSRDSKVRVILNRFQKGSRITTDVVRDTLHVPVAHTLGNDFASVIDAINRGLIPGPRLRISGNAIDVLGGHEDANKYNPAQHVLSNADYANSAEQLVEVMRQQHKEGSDFAKIYETGHDNLVNGVLHTPYQYTADQLRAAVTEGHRLGAPVAVHAMGEPGTLYAAQAGVASIDHATQLSDETIRLMREKGIFAVPTFTIFEYFAKHRESQDQAAVQAALLDYKVVEFKKQIAAGVQFAVGSDVGPFPHGTQGRELELMVQYGMKPLAVLQADLINGAKLLGWEGQIGQLKPGFFADIIAVKGNPLEDISAVTRVSFVMRDGAVIRQ